MKRQALTTNSKELRNLADEIDRDNKDFEKKFGLKSSHDSIIPIVNKTNFSDEWRFEKKKASK
jgi:hypothetical protein